LKEQSADLVWLSVKRTVLRFGFLGYVVWTIICFAVCFLLKENRLVWFGQILRGQSAAGSVWLAFDDESAENAAERLSNLPQALQAVSPPHVQLINDGRAQPARFLADILNNVLIT
jgi:hypothetical protein